MDGKARINLIEQRELVHLITGVLIFGSLWGFLEATLGGFLHMILFPNKGAIMSGIGVAIMASALAIYKKPVMAIGIGTVAASFKLLDVWIFALPPSSYHIVNPAVAIIIEALAFSVITVFIMNRLARNAYIGIGAGVLMGLISATAYINFALYATPLEVLTRQGVNTAGPFIMNQGLVQAAFWGALLPLGYLGGEKLVARISLVSTSKLLYSVSMAAGISFCWIISAIARIVGFN